jgi:hypothetical protein
MTTKRWKVLTAAVFGGLLAITWAGAAIADFGPPPGHGEQGYGEGERLRDGSCLEMLGVELEDVTVTDFGPPPGHGEQGYGEGERLRDGSCMEE